MKRVLLTTFPYAFLHHGGGEREIHLLCEALAASGVMADIYGPTSKAVSTYDAAIHFSMMGGSEHVVQALADEGLRLILWPNLWFVSPPTMEHLTSLKRFLSLFEAVVFRSRTEEAHFCQYFDLTGKEVIRVSYLVSPKFLRCDISDVFRESYGLSRFAIWPGIIEPQKNQLAAVRAFSGTNVDLVISGRVRDEAYAARCRAEAGDNVRFIPPMSFGSELHLSALAYSSFFVELPLDFPGTSALEAASVGANLILSKSEWVEEMLGGDCTQVFPGDVDGIRVAISSIDDIRNSAKTVRRFRSMPESISALTEYIKFPIAG